MFIVEITYKKPLVVVDEYLQEHRDFLRANYAKGLLIASGPCNPRTGGVIIAVGDREEVDQLIQEDPFYTNGVADYRVVEFEAKLYCEQLQSYFE